MTTSPQIAVIILNWNGEKLLRRFLPSVIANTNPAIADVIVADNGSTDNSVNVLEQEFPEVKLLKFSQNYGFAEGYNHAISHFKNYTYTILLNSDVETPSQWVEPLWEAMEADKTIGACQPKIRSVDEPEKFEYAGASGGFIDRNGFPYCRGRIFNTTEIDNGQYDSQTDIFWATGAALMVRTELYLKLGGLDSKFFAHMEEIDLCWRILLNKNRIVAVPKSRVYHLGGGSLPASNPRKTYLNFRNNLLLLHKNIPTDNLFGTLLRRRLLDTVAWAKFMLTGEFANANSILRAHNDFRKMRKEYTDHPDENLLRNRPDCRRNILSDYFLHRRHKFSMLPPFNR